jgi:PE-PPE domain
MSGRKLRWLTAGMFATASAGMLSMTAIMNPAFAFGDAGDIGLVIGGTGDPNPGPGYVELADLLYIDQKYAGDITSFYQETGTNPFGPGLYTPEQAYPLFGGGVQQLYYNLTDPSTDLPGSNTSVGQGADILENTILSDIHNGEGSTVFGYSQSSTLAGFTMQLLEQQGITNSTPDAPQFLLIADPNNPNGGLFERFNGFETTSGQTVVDPLSLSSFGVSFDGATPSDDFTTNVYTLEYDGFADFPRYPLNFLSDLNAFLGIAELHGTYLDYPVNGTGPTPEDIADAKLLPGSELSGTPDSLTNYYMIDTIDGAPVTPPLVSLLGELPVIGQPLEDLLGPDLTVLINLGYGGDNLGYSDAPANIPTPFGLFPDVNPTTLANELVAGAQTGFAAFGNDLSTFSFASLPSAFDATNPLTTIETALADPASLPSITEVANALSTVASTAYSTVLPTADIINSLLTSLPAYDVSLFIDNLQTGDLVDALGLPLAANTAIDTLAAGFEYEILSDAASSISATLSALF